MFVIENKLSLSNRRVKSMHYPESPKVTVLECHILNGFFSFQTPPQHQNPHLMIHHGPSPQQPGQVRISIFDCRQ